MTSENNPLQPVTQGEFRDAMQLVDRRFISVDRRFDQIDTRFNNLVLIFLNLEDNYKSTTESILKSIQASENRILTRMDEFLRNTENYEYTVLSQGERLKDHDERIIRLESPKPQL
jgi:hypothetical protein